MPEQAKPVLEASRFHKLAEDCEKFEDAVNFLATYRQLLPHRVSRILSALRNEDADAALDAILSLKTSSSMTGALQMEHNCRRLQDGLRGGTDMKILAASTSLEEDTPSLLKGLQEMLDWLAIQRGFPQRLCPRKAP